MRFSKRCLLNDTRKRSIPKKKKMFLKNTKTVICVSKCFLVLVGEKKLLVVLKLKLFLFGILPIFIKKFVNKLLYTFKLKLKVAKFLFLLNEFKL